jgi:hypothetical protein
MQAGDFNLHSGRACLSAATPLTAVMSFIIPGS